MAPPNSSVSAQSTVTASVSIPIIYRIMLTTVEPVFALSGAALAFSNPSRLVRLMTRNSATFESDMGFLYTTAGGAWVYFASIELIMLRFSDDVRLWRLLCLCMLFSDAACCYGTIQAVGGWSSWIMISEWTIDERVSVLLTACMMLIRAHVVVGTGLGMPGGRPTEARLARDVAFSAPKVRGLPH